MFSPRYITIGLILFAVFYCFQWSCNPFQKNAIQKLKHVSFRSLLPNAHQTRSGDLILRHGKGIISESFMFMSLKDRKFSHAGMVLVEGDSIYVVHALGGETAVDNAVKKHSLAEFCDPADNHSFAIYRYKDMNDEQRQSFVNEMLDAYRKKINFDMDFSMETDSVQYCSELVWKSITHAMKDINYLDQSKNAEGRAYVAVDNLYYNKHTQLLYESHY